VTYASFWQRLGAFLIDFLCLLPLTALVLWLSSTSRLFQLWYYIPGLFIGAWFYVDLVKRFGGTPGKLVVGIRIRKVDGTPVGYKEAWLRYVVLFILSALSSAALVLAALKMSDAEYLSLDWQQRAVAQQALAPAWYTWVSFVMNGWIWSEFLVMLTNAKRRALHDFMAGTVVVRIDGGQKADASDPAEPRS
jgi:uncharacterized RDD family membrane protein YckC